MKKRLLILAVNIIPIIIFFFICEIYLRRLGMEPYVRTFPGQYQDDPNGVAWAQPDPVLGWTSNKMDPEMNPQGFRDPKDFETVELDSGKIRVMVLGDSFIWGAGVSIDKNVTGLLQSKLKNRYEFFNLGVPGWGIDQMYLAYKRYKDVIKPDIVILAFIDDDVNRVLEAYRTWESMNKPSFAVEDGELVLRTPGSKSQLFLNHVLGKSIFLSKIREQIYLVTDARAVVKQIFLTMAQETRQRNEKFIVVRIPTQDHFDYITQIDRDLYDFEEMLKKMGVPYLDPSAEMTTLPNWEADFYLDDGHMSTTGNQYLAEYIHSHVVEESNRLSDVPDENR